MRVGRSRYGRENADAPGSTDSTLILTPTERETLERWTRCAKTAQAVAQRARLILGCAAGKTNTVVAYELPLTKQTVGKWRTRFLRRRLDGLLDEPRPGAPRTITDVQVERVLTQTLETTPADATHLEHPLDGPGQQAQPERSASDLARLRAAAPSDRDVQTVRRPAIHRGAPAGVRKTQGQVTTGQGLSPEQASAYNY